MSLDLKGLFAAPYTPMDPSGAVNFETVGRLAKDLKANGVNGAFINGTTGESMSLTVYERKQLAEQWIAAAGADWPVIVHIGHLCLLDAKALAAHAAETGAFGIAATSPCYYKPQSVGDLVDLCAEIAAEAPKTPFYYYHIPCMTNVNFRVSDFFALANEKIPTLRGAKFSHEDLADLCECVHFEGGRYEMMFGKDEMLLSGLAVGAKAFVGSTFNFAAPLYVRLIEAFESGNLEEAQREQLASAKLISILNRFRGAVAGKALMKMIGLDCGPARLPQRSLSGKECEALRRELDGLGFFDSREGSEHQESQSDDKLAQSAK